jgi:TorA maturation chaperone TorD
MTGVHESALLRSTIYGVLAHAVHAPADETDDQVGSSASAATLLCELLERAGATAAADVARRLAGTAPSANAARRVFGHTPESAVPAYETQYGNDTLFGQPRELSDIGAFVAAFGLTVDPARHERVDHVSCECELMCFLAAKEAYALEHRDDAMRSIVADAEKRFLREHLGRFAPAFGERLRRTDPQGFLGTMGSVLRRFVEWDCARIGVEAGDLGLALRKPGPEESVPIACGTAPECGGCES